MGEIVEVDVRQLRTVAGRVADAADSIAGIHCKALDPGALAGSAVATAADPGPMAARLTRVVADMHHWARAAHTSADGYEQAERRAGDRVAR